MSQLTINESTLPALCVIKGEQYHLKIIMATPIQDPQQTLFYQTATFNDSQGREVLKGGRNVGDHRREENPEN